MTETIAKDVHNARVAELHAAINTEVERRRTAERAWAVNNTVIANLGEALYEAKQLHLGYWLADIMAWQHETFGPLQTLEGIRDHMRREVKEIEDAPEDRTEPIDLIMLGISYLRKLGLDAAEIVALWQQRMVALKGRTWPDWRTADPDKAIEHHRKPMPTQEELDDCYGQGLAARPSEPQAQQPDIYSHPTTGPEPSVEGDLRTRLKLAQTGSCTCGTKTDDIAFHNPTCPYRVLNEAAAVLDDALAIADEVLDGPPPQPIERSYTVTEIEVAFRSFAGAHVDTQMQDHGHWVSTTKAEQDRQADSWWTAFHSGLVARRLANGGRR